MEFNINYKLHKVGPPLSIKETDLSPETDLFGLFYSELLKESLSSSMGAIDLDLSLVFQEEVLPSDSLNVVYAFHKLYNLHRHIKPVFKVGSFTVEQLRETRSVFLQLSIVQRTILLSLLHFICSERILDVCYKVFADTLIGLEMLELKLAIGA